MSIFSKQKQFCPICGKEFTTKLSWNKPVLCSGECREEFQWRATLSILGKEYYPQNEQKPMTDS